MVRAPGTPKAPRAQKAAAQPKPKPKAPAEPAVAPEFPTIPSTGPNGGADRTVPETVAPAPKPAQAAAPEAPAPLELVPVPAYFMVGETITPSTKRHPGATMQYTAGRFYVADEFLTELWRDGDPCIEPYTPEPGE